MALYPFLEQSTGGGGGLIPGMGTTNTTGIVGLGGTQSLMGDAVAINPTDYAIKSGIPGTSPTGTSPTQTNPLAAVGTDNVFSANTASIPGGGTGGVQDLNVGNLLGFNSPNAKDIIGQLDTLFGKGVGQVFYNFLSGGAGYNPQVASALINQMAPYEERTRNQILESFGAAGNRYSSPAAIGIGDFESSFRLGQQGILANLYNQAVDRYSNMFGGILDTAHLEQANKLSTWDIISGILGILGNTGLFNKLGGILGGLGSRGGAGGGGGTSTGGTPPIFPPTRTGGETPWWTTMPSGGLQSIPGTNIPPPNWQDAGILGGIDPTVLEGIFGTGLGGELGNIGPGGTSSWSMVDPTTGDIIQSGGDTGLFNINDPFGVGTNPFDSSWDSWFSGDAGGGSGD